MRALSLLWLCASRAGFGLAAVRVGSTPSDVALAPQSLGELLAKRQPLAYGALKSLGEDLARAVQPGGHGRGCLTSDGEPLPAHAHRLAHTIVMAGSEQELQLEVRCAGAALALGRWR